MPTTLIHIYIQTWKLHISGIIHFSLFHCESGSTPQCTEPCQMAEVFVGLGTFKDRRKKRERGVWKKVKEAPCLRLWSVSVIAWSAISSSPTEVVSYAAGRQPKRPPAPRTPAAGAGGPCSTWPHPGMTSAGRGKWTGRGGGGMASSRRLRTEKKSTYFPNFDL